MDNGEEAPKAMEKQQLGAETPWDDFMLSVVMDKDGRAQALLRDNEGNVVVATSIIGPVGEVGQQDS